MDKKKKNICLIHGWGANISKLKPLRTELEKLGWKVFLPKIPFFDNPEPQRPWNLADFAEYIENQSNNYFNNSSYCLFGHSLGGRIAIKISSEKKVNLEAVILCAAAGITQTNKFKKTFFLILTKIFIPIRLIAPPLFPTVRKIIYRLAGSSDYLQIRSEIKKQTFRYIVSENLKNQSMGISVPTLILWGKQDHITPIKDAFFLQAKIKQSKLKIFEGENHRLPYNKPKEIAQNINIWYQNI